jgi:hypothetical protein
MRRSRLAELRRARPAAYVQGLRKAAFDWSGCWRTTPEGRAAAAALAEAVAQLRASEHPEAAPEANPAPGGAGE